MARLLTTGFETGGKNVEVYGHGGYYVGSSGSTSLVSPGRTGNYCLQVRSSELSTQAVQLAFDEADEVYIGAAVYITDSPEDFHNFLALMHDGTVLMQLRVGGADSGQHLLVYNRATGVTHDSGFSLATGTWFWIELHYLIDDINGRIELRVEGNELLDVTEDTKYGDLTTANGVRFLGYNAHAGLEVYGVSIDDLVINDASGAIDNAWPGPVRLEPLFPNASGDVGDWSLFPNSGESDWEDIDERPPDNDTSYLTAQESGKQFLVHLEDWSETGKVISKAHIKVVVVKTEADGTNRIKLLAKQGGVLHTGVAQELSTQWDYGLKTEQLDNAPDGGAWEDAKIDALQIGAEMEVV